MFCFDSSMDSKWVPFSILLILGNKNVTGCQIWGIVQMIKHRCMVFFHKKLLYRKCLVHWNIVLINNPSKTIIYGDSSSMDHRNVSWIVTWDIPNGLKQLSMDIMNHSAKITSFEQKKINNAIIFWFAHSSFSDLWRMILTTQCMYFYWQWHA